ncbi:MAG: hypothetical protein IKF68_00300 [Erysipelotrichaceae bacterium]|nr:hypothetical protein [Erysipelotrichaceae bacterium]
MGILDKIIKEGTKIIEEAATPENKEKVTSFLNDLKDNLGEAAEEIKKQVGDLDLGQLKEALVQDGPKEIVDESIYEEDPSDQRDCREKILAVLGEEFPECEVKENVSPRELGGEGNFMDISILVCKGGTPALAIMIIGKTTCSHREYRWSREFAGSKNIPFINFIRHYPNNTEYIKQRLHKYL